MCHAYEGVMHKKVFVKKGNFNFGLGVLCKRIKIMCYDKKLYENPVELMVWVYKKINKTFKIKYKTQHSFR